MTFEVPALAAGFASKFDTIGPYVGFASLIAVVAMAVLVFAQGRELQRLREWAGTSPERLTSLEQRIDDELRQARPNGAVNRFPGQAAGAAVPAAAAQGATAARPAAPGAPPAPPGTPGAPVGAPGGAAAPGQPAPGTPGATPRPTPPRPGAPVGAGGQATRVVPAAGGPGAATAAGRAASANARSRTAGSGDGGGSDRSIPQLIGVAAVGLVVVVAILFALGVFGGGDDPKDQADRGTAAATRTAKDEPTQRFSPADTNVTVLNASGTDGLARTVSQILDNRRFEMGEASNYTVNGAPKSEATTTVEYKAGSGSRQRRQAALAIAGILKLSSRQVKAMSADTRSAVQDIPDVVVIVGADYARKNPQGVQPDSGASTTTPSGSSSGGAAGTSGSGAAGGTTNGATGGSTGGSTGSGGATGSGAAGGTTDGGVDGGAGGTTDGAAGAADGSGTGALTP